MEMLINVVKILGLIVLILVLLVVIYGIIAGTINVIIENRKRKKFIEKMLPNALEKLNELAKEEIANKKKTTKTTKKTTKTAKKDSE